MKARPTPLLSCPQCNWGPARALGCYMDRQAEEGDCFWLRSLWCEGFLCLPRWSVKGNSSGLGMACGSSSCVGCTAPSCGLGVWCLLACEPPNEWIATTETSLSASKWTSEEKLIVSSLSPWYFWYSLWLITCHGGISPLPLSCFTLCIYLCRACGSCS